MPQQLRRQRVSNDIADLVASNRDLADAIRGQTVALMALADAIAAPMEGDEPASPPVPRDDVDRYMDGSPVGD